MVAPLRILYIALSLMFGLGLATAGMLGLVDALGADGTGGPDAPPPFGLSTYVYTPIIGVLVVLSTMTAVKHLWRALALLCWFLLGGAVLDALYVIWLLVRHGIVPESVDDAFAVVWALFPILGLLLTAAAKSSEQSTDAPQSASTQEKIRLRNTLIGVAAVSYFWRVIVVAFNPGMTFAIAYLRGMTELYGSEQVTLSGVIGATAAIALLACVAMPSKKIERILHATLAFTIGFALEGFLDTIDYVFWFGTPRELTSSLQDAVAFVACSAALALSLHGERMSSRLTTV